MSKIKSEKAKKYLRRVHGSMWMMPKYQKERFINPYTLTNSIIKAESDARDRAVRAFVKVLSDIVGDDMTNSPEIEQFKQAYDNE